MIRVLRYGTLYFDFSKQIDFYSLLVPCEPPFNITVGVIDSVTINISWIQPHCRDGKYVYIMYKKVADASMENWSIHGVKNGGKNHTMLQYLEQAKDYKGYLLQSTIHGNGPPSHVVYFRTIIGRRFISFQKKQYFGLNSHVLISFTFKCINFNQLINKSNV